MKPSIYIRSNRFLKLSLVFFVLLFGALIQSNAQAFTLNVVDSSGAPIGVGYRWLVEEATTPVTPGVQDPNSLAFGIHRSHSPVVAAGDETTTPLPTLDTTKYYFVSVLPNSGYTIGGAALQGNGSVTVRVNSHPVPTAQISVFVFKDDKAINGVADIPAESGLPGFNLKVFDNAGQVMFDALGNSLEGLVTDANGRALIKNLAPGKYDVEASPTDGQPWIQTVTIGGDPKLPAVVRAGEPAFLPQGGLLNMHVFIGFIQPFRNNVLLPTTGANTITGRVVNVHSGHPPAAQLYPGIPVKDCYVGLNLVEAGTETGVVVQACNTDSEFSIENVPAGTYQLVMWDEHLSNIMSVRTVTVPDPVSGPTLALGDIPITRWVGTVQGSVFLENGIADGVRQGGERGIPDQAINLRHRDGSIYQATVTDIFGNYELSQIAILGQWLITEVDFARFKATGASYVADLGGELHSLPISPFDSVNNPSAAVPELGPVLLEGIIVQPDQINVINFGKQAYPPGENGGIAGIVFYATTRAEDDPAFAVGEEWEPGIPRVQVNLYRDWNDDGVIDDVTGDGTVTLADVDNYPFQWTDVTLPAYTGVPGPEDNDRNGNGVFDLGDALRIAYTDSFDDNLPTDCIDAAGTPGVAPYGCGETLQTWNQVRPAVFDGGYAFGPKIDCPGGVCPDYVTPSADPNIGYLKPGIYIVEAVPPPGYVTVKEEDRNVDFGDEYIVPLLLPPVCVNWDDVDNDGNPGHTVPPFLSLFPDIIPTPAAGQYKALCDRKQVPLNPGQNAASDFFVFTWAPKAGQIVGKAVNLFANANAGPNQGGVLTPSWLPVTVLDPYMNTVVTVHTDEFGAYSTLLPSTFSTHVPMPSGVSPNVFYVCSNYPSSDQFYDPRFNQPCLNVEVWPGRTTYVLNPVGALAGFTGSTTTTDCEYPNVTPVIDQVNGPGGGPFVTASGETITITSLGTAVQVRNPSFGQAGQPEFITRDYGFGATPGTVTVGGVPLTIAPGGWTASTITATVPAWVSTGQLLVTRVDTGITSEMGVTLHVGGPAPIRVPGNYPTVQAAIDAASAGGLILVAPDTYNENLIMWKPVKLQGYGARATIINAANFTANATAWQTLLSDKVTSGAVTLVGGQRADLAQEQGAGITVMAKNATPAAGGYGFEATGRPNALIDGFTIQGATWGSGILVNGYARALVISNNLLQGNQGTLGGAIRVGWQSLVNRGSILTANPGYYSAHNDQITIQHNQIVKNGSAGDGGAIGLFNGSDNYAVTDNYICGNYTALNGAIAHHGLSDNGLIAFNKIIFNEAFGEGAAIQIGGEFLPAGAVGLAPGAGSVNVVSNLIQGNLAGDDGGGISIFSASGQDVLGASPYQFNFLNNIIVNNLAGFSGAGIALSDTVNVNILHNTIAHNDNLSTAAAFVGGGLMETSPMGSGIVSRGNSPGLAAATGQTFVNPVLDNNIIWHNRSWFWRVTPTVPAGELFPDTVSPYWDLQVFGVPGASLNPRSCLLSDLTDLHSGGSYNVNNNIVSATDPFVGPYLNIITVTAGANAPANFPTFEPRTPTGNYHIVAGSTAIGAANGTLDVGFPYLAADFDTEPRPMSGTYDIGADEFTAAFGAIAPTIVSAEVTTGTTGEPYIYQVEAQDPNIGDRLTFSLINAPAGMTVDPNTGVIQWASPVAGDHSVTVQVSDGTLSTLQTFTVSITVSANQTPGAVNQVVTTSKGVPVEISLAYTDLDGPVTIHTFTVVTPPSSGTLGAIVDGKVTYTPNAEFAGDDSFTWSMNDGGGIESNIATATIKVGTLAGVFVQCPDDTNGNGIPPTDIYGNVLDPGDIDAPNVKCMHITGGDGYSVMADGKVMYMFGFKNVTAVPPDQVMMEGMLGAEWPAPTITVDEGDHFYLTLTNAGMAGRPDLFDPHSVHWHGFPEASSIFDGVPEVSIAINMGASLTYYYRVVEPGTYMWHCHVEATEHMQMGMLGNLYVRPAQNKTGAPGAPIARLGGNPDPTAPLGYAYNDGDGSTAYDVEYPIQMLSLDREFHDASEAVQPLPFAYMDDDYFMLNGRGYPDTVNPDPLPAPAENGEKVSQSVSSLITATQGEKILLRISNLNVTRFNTLASTIPMLVVGKDAKLLRGPSPDGGITPGVNLYYMTNSVTLGGGESNDVIIDTSNVASGTHFLYSTNLNLLSNNVEDFGGMMTEIRVQASGGGGGGGGGGGSSGCFIEALVN